MRLLRGVYPACASAAGTGELAEGLAMTSRSVIARSGTTKQSLPSNLLR
jgi:hypothetical protein